MNKFILSISIAIIFSSCTEVIKVENPHYNEKYEAGMLSLDSGVVQQFTLNELTHPLDENIQFININNEDYIAFLSIDLNKIYFYSCDGRVLHDSIVINEINFKPNAFHVHSYDSTFLYSHDKKEILLINRDGKPINNYDITYSQNSKEHFPVYPFLSASNPLFVDSCYLYYSGFVIGEQLPKDNRLRFLSARINLIDKSIEYINMYPQFYENGNWGGKHFRIPYSTVNKGERIQVLSLPADHYLIIRDLKNNKTERKYAGSKFIKEIKSNNFSSSKNNEEAYKKKINQNFYTSNSYRNIIYDEFNKQYYRIVEFAVAKEDLNDNGLGYKKLGLIVLDENFNILREIIIDHGLSIWSYYVSKEGLVLLNYLNKNEAIAIFHTYKM